MSRTLPSVCDNLNVCILQVKTWFQNRRMKWKRINQTEADNELASPYASMGYMSGLPTPLPGYPTGSTPGMHMPIPYGYPQTTVQQQPSFMPRTPPVGGDVRQSMMGQSQMLGIPYSNLSPSNGVYYPGYQNYAASRPIARPCPTFPV